METAPDVAVAAEAFYKATAEEFYRAHTDRPPQSWDGLSNRTQEDWMFLAGRLKRAGYDLEEMARRLAPTPAETEE